MATIKQNYSFVKLAIEKGINDIQENQPRGLRNLVDLGEMFASGRFQKEFFAIAQQELSNEDSPYYRLIERILKNTDAKHLMSFGMNLGYNCWTSGADQIRMREAEEGFNIPWCLFLNMGTTDEFLDPKTIADLITQGRELGIYCYMITLDEDYPQVNELLCLLSAESDCAFIVFIRPHTVSHQMTAQLKNVPNLWILLDLDSECFDQVKEASACLLSAGILCGGYSQYTELDSSAIMQLKTADKLDLAFVIFVDTKKHHPLSADNVSNILLEMRKNLNYPVLPIDLYYDAARIDCNISSESCLTAVLADGTVRMSDEQSDYFKTDLNIHHVRLKECLKMGVPKQV